MPPGARALVLGAGGVTGVAWSFGLLAGLADAGLRLDDADVVVGTSAGSIVGLSVAAGVDARVAFEAQTRDAHPVLAARVRLGAVAQFVWHALRARTPADYAARMARLALAAPTPPESVRRESLASRLPTHAWPARALWITAVDTATGALEVFDAGGSAPLVDAVAASCAAPGVWPPVTIDGRRFMDGAVHSVANAQLAAGAACVVAIAPIPRGRGPTPSVFAQAEALRRAGARVAVVSPDAASRRAIGRNNLNPARRAPAARAGFTQATHALAEVRAVWAGGR